MVVWLDYGHGINTKGKQAVVEGQHIKEWVLNKEIGEKIRQNLLNSQIPVRLTNESDSDISLTQRVANVKKDDLFVSIHNNAFNGKARGFEIFTSVGKTKADLLADLIIEQIEPLYKILKVPLRYDLSDGDKDKEKGFYVLRKTPCPAVLIEVMFFDNPIDLAILQCEAFQQEVARLISVGIKNFLETR